MAMDQDKAAEILARFEQARMDHYYQDARARIRATTDLAMLWLRSMFIICGGAIIALFTLLRPSDSFEVNGSALWLSFSLFSLALILTLVALFVGYMGQDTFFDAEFQTAEQIYEQRTGKAVRTVPASLWRVGNLQGIAARILAGLAMAALVGGGVSALIAVRIS